jgi:tetratricopeptide (TPR) repeat protein
MRILVLAVAVLSTSALAAPPRAPAAAEPVMTPVAQTRYRDAVAMVTSGNYSGATETLNALAGEYPRVAEIFASRCSAQLGLAHHAEAAADCTYALTLKPQLASARYALAIAEEGMGKTQAAITHYREYAAYDDAQAPYKAQALARVNALTAVPTGPLPVAAPPAPGAAAGAPAAAQAQGRQGTIVVYRNRLMRTEYSQLTLFVDGRPVGDIGHDQYVEIQIDAGDHYVEARTAVYSIFMRPIVLSSPVTVGAGASYLGFDYVMGQPALVQVPAETARNEIRQDCRKAYTRKLSTTSL